MIFIGCRLMLFTAQIADGKSEAGGLRSVAGRGGIGWRAEIGIIQQNAIQQTAIHASLAIHCYLKVPSYFRTINLILMKLTHMWCTKYVSLQNLYKD